MTTDQHPTTRNKKMVWIIDDDRSIRWVLEKTLQQANYTTRSFDRGDAILFQLEKEQPDLIITDVRMPGMDGFGVLKVIREKSPKTPVIIMTAHSDLDSTVAAYKNGAFDYLPKPFDIDEAVALINRALKQANQTQTITDTPPPQHKSENNRNHLRPESQSLPKIAGDIIGKAPSMQEVFRAIGRLSHSSVTVLIQGQSGTGKELVAAALHKHSIRKDKPYIALNMAAIPKDLIESELFGHEKGAFTGAQHSRIGRFEQANNGTLFLDEIGDMPMETQTRLLRVLADKEFYRVGGQAPIKVNVRIIAATHQNLEALVKRNLFREDLYHRLNVINIQVPPLRERQEDIPQLAESFLKKAAQEMSVELKTLSQEACEYLCQQPWPGNVRQLENICHWLSVMSTSKVIYIEDLPNSLKSEALIKGGKKNPTWEFSLQQWAQQELLSGKKNLLDIATPSFERVMIEAALQHSNGRKKDASELLGWGRNTLTRKLKELKNSEEPEP